MKKIATAIQTWFSNIWARGRWTVIVSLALVLLIATAGLWFPVKLKWKLVRSFRNFWRGVTEDWDDKWDTIEDMLGINGVGDGAKIAAACADCDVCLVAQTRFFHKYNVADVKEIIREGGVTILEDVPPLFIDIRTEEDYIKGHIPEAINMPLAELKTDIWPSRRDTPLVIIGYAETDYIELGKDLVDNWCFYNAGYLVGGMDVWDGEIESFE